MNRVGGVFFRVAILGDLLGLKTSFSMTSFPEY